MEDKRREKLDHVSKKKWVNLVAIHPFLIMDFNVK